MEQMILPICVFEWYSVTGEIESMGKHTTVLVLLILQ